MKEAIVRALREHHPKLSTISFTAGLGEVWECSHLICHAKGTLEHIVDHQAEEVAVAVYHWQDARIR